MFGVRLWVFCPLQLCIQACFKHIPVQYPSCQTRGLEPIPLARSQQQVIGYKDGKFFPEDQVSHALGFNSFSFFGAAFSAARLYTRGVRFRLNCRNVELERKPLVKKSLSAHDQPV